MRWRTCGALVALVLVSSCASKRGPHNDAGDASAGTPVVNVCDATQATCSPQDIAAKPLPANRAAPAVANAAPDESD